MLINIYIFGFLTSLTLFMKKYLLIILVFGALQISAQNTINISWGFDSNPSQAQNSPQQANRTVEVGDTVMWTWIADGGRHNVTSNNGSTEAFASGSTMAAPNTYSYTFTAQGTNPYRCEPHSGNMNGTITVVPDGTLSVTENFKLNLKSFPNPVESELNVSSFVKISKIEIFSILGKKLVTTNIDNLNSTSIKMNSLQTGLYFVNVFSENGDKAVLRIIKK